MLAHSIPFSPEHDADAFAQLPAAPGVFLLRGHDASAEPYVSKTSNLRRKIQRLLAPPESHSKRLNLRERCAAIEFAATGSDFENLLLLYRTLREVFPKSYGKRMRLNHSALVRIHWENAWPRAYLTNKLSLRGGRSVYFGPFRSRASAESFLNDVLDLFKSRRCTFELHPDPTFPGCVYSEMKMCLAPCFKGCTEAEYLVEMRRVEQFLDDRGATFLAELATQRERASEATDFESAAALHTKIEKAKSALRLADEITRRLDRLEALVLQPGTESGSIAAFHFAGCQFEKPFFLATPEAGIQDALKTYLGQLEDLSPPSPASALLQMEHLALLKRWYFRGSRTGEIFFRGDDGRWPARKIANGIARLLGTEERQKEADSSPSLHSGSE